MQGAEQCAGDNRLRVRVGSRSATPGTRHLLGQARAHLLVDQDRVHLLEKVHRLFQLQAERVDRHRIAVDLGHLVHD